LALGGEFTKITSLLMKFDFSWEIEQPTTVAGWEQLSSKTFTCRLAVVRNFLSQEVEQCRVVTFFTSAQIIIIIIIIIIN